MLQAQFDEFLAQPQTPQAFVPQALRLLETAFRELALQALADFDRAEVALKGKGPWTAELYLAIGSLQRPSWGVWNGLLTALRRTRAACLAAGDPEVATRLNQAAVLSATLERLDTPAEPAMVERLRPLARFVNVSLDGRIRLGRLLELPIALRNRVAHDTPTDPDWWETAATVLRPLVELHASGLVAASADHGPGDAPWLVSDDEDLWAFNGVEKDYTPVYVSRSGRTRYDAARAGEVLLGFQRLLGAAGERDRDVKALLARLAPEELRGVLFGDYLLGRPVGAGAFATVHLGRQLSTGRKVAIKILKNSQDEGERRRFQQEAAFLARIDHPNVVKVIGRGEETWSPPRVASPSGEEWYEEFSRSSRVKSYIALEWLDGETLESMFRRTDGSRTGVATVVGWFAEAAEALAAVHAARLIHRDVKPQNLMLTSDGRVKLMDFGIARGDSASRTVQTEAGQVLGTPEYMSPEQLRVDAAAADVGPASDLYSLCATFFELFTGARLYHHDTVERATVITMKLDGRAPERPRQIEAGLPWEVETLLLGGLEFDPGSRPASAADLAADLRRVLEHRPIRYKRPPLWRRARLFYRRNPALVHVAAVALVAFGVGGVVASRMLQSERQKTEQQKGLVTKAESARDVAKKLAEENRLKKVREEYLNDMDDAPALFANARVDELRELLERYRNPASDDPRGFEWYYWWRLAHPGRTTITSRHGPCWRVALDPSGKRILGLARTGQVTLWDAVTGKELYTLPSKAEAFAFSPDGKSLLTAGGQGEPLRLFDAEQGRERAQFPTGWGVTALAYAPDGSKFVTGDFGATLSVRDARTGRQLLELTNNRFSQRDITNPMAILDKQQGPILDLAFHPDGKRVASASEDGSVHLWEVASGRLAGRFPGEDGPVSSLAFSSDGSMLATMSLGTRDDLRDQEVAGKILVRKVDGGAVGEPIQPRPEYMPVGGSSAKVKSTGRTGDFRLAFSKDGKRLTAASQRSVKTWELPGGTPVDELVGHSGLVLSVALAADGRIVTSGEDAVIKIWDPSSARQTVRVLEHPFGVRGIGVSPGGNRLAAVLEPGALVSHGLNGETRSRDVNGAMNLTLLELDSRTGQQVARFGETTGIRGWPWTGPVDYSDDGKKLAARFVWDATTHSEVLPESRLRRTMSVSRDGKTVAAVTIAGLEIWDVAPARVRRTIPIKMDSRAPAPAFSPDGSLLAGALPEGGIRVWGTADGRAVRNLKGHAVATRALAFSPDGKTLASGGDDQFVRVWNLADGALLFDRHGHRREVTALCFSPDGRRLLSSSGDPIVASNTAGEVKLWELLTGRECLTLDGGGTSLFGAAAFSPDGRKIFAASTELPPSYGQTSPGAVLLWDGTDPEEPGASPEAPARAEAVADARGAGLVETPAFDRFVKLLAFSPKGNRLVAVTREGEMAVFDAERGRWLRDLKANRGHAIHLAFDTAGKRLVSVKPYWSFSRNQGPTEVKVWDLELFQLLREITPASGTWPLAAAFRPGGKGGIVLIPNKTRAEGEARVELHPSDDSDRAPEVLPLAGSPEQLVAAAVSPDGKSLACLVTPASRSRDDGPLALKIWDLGTRKLVHTFAEVGRTPWNLQFSADGRHVGLAIGEAPPSDRLGSIREVRVWEIGSGRAVAPKVPSKLRFPFALSPDGRTFATAVDDSLGILVCDTADGHAVRTLPGPLAAISALAFSPDGRRLACGAIEGPVQLWDLSAPDTGRSPSAAPPLPRGTELIPVDPPVGRLTGASSGELVELIGGGSPARVDFGKGGRIATFALDKELRFWDSNARRVSASSKDDRGGMRLHPSSVLASGFDPEGKIYTVVSRVVDLPGPGRASRPQAHVEVTRRDAVTGELVGEPLTLPVSAPTGGGTVAVLAGGRWLAVKHAGADGRSFNAPGSGYQVWDVVAGSKTAEVQTAETLLSLSNDGQTLVLASNNSVKTRTVGEGKDVRSFSPTPTGLRRALGASLSDDGKTLMAVYEGEVETWAQGRAPGGTSPLPKKKARGPRAKRNPVAPPVLPAPSRPGAAADSRATLIVWDRATGRPGRPIPLTLEGIRTLGNLYALAIGRDGSRLAIGGAGRLFLFATGDGKELGRLDVVSGQIGSVAFQPDGPRVAVASSSPSLWLWNPRE